MDKSEPDARLEKTCTGWLGGDRQNQTQQCESILWKHH